MRFARLFLCLLGALAALPASSRAVLAQPVYADEEIRQTVARIAYVDGPVVFSRGDDPDNWEAAVRNVPMTLGDRIYTAEGRAELQVHGADFIRLSRDTDLAALNLTEEIKQFSLTAGSASFSVRRLGRDETFEVDTPNAAVTFERSGYYRVDVDPEGSTRVLVRRGEAMVAAAGGQVPLSEGSEMRIEGIEDAFYDVYAIPRPDSWDRWVDFREARIDRSPSYRYVNADIVGVADLDEYGAWDNIPQYGRCWTPSRVAVGWQPYVDGHWMWQDPWGWTWVAEEPWGWAPYHYGRWVAYRSRWYWVPAGPSARVSYAPAMVAFVGGGPGFSLQIGVDPFGAGRGYVGWFPLGPRDPFVPWWGDRNRTTVNVTNVTYVNQRFVTVVNPTAFTSGAPVRAAIVRDPGVVRQVMSAPVVRGALSVVPTASSLRMAPSTSAPIPARPPAAISARPVVTRLAVPPAPPRFDQKVAAIRENRGAPLPPAQSARIAVQNQGARSVAPVRPVATPQGGVTFAPKRPESSLAPRPQPVTAPPGKALATPQRPIVSTPAEAANPNAQPPARIAPGSVAPPVREAQPGARPVPPRPAPQQTPAPRSEPPVARPVAPQDRSSPAGQPSTYTRPPRNVPPPRPEAAPPARPVPAPPAREAAPPPRKEPAPRAVPAPQPSTYTRPPASRNAPPPAKTEKEKKDKEKSDKEKKDREKQPPPPA